MTAPLRLRLKGDALATNWRWLRAKSGQAACGAAVKANGYGLGAVAVVELARLLVDKGVGMSVEGWGGLLRACRREPVGMGWALPHALAATLDRRELPPRIGDPMTTDHPAPEPGQRAGFFLACAVASLRCLRFSPSPQQPAKTDAPATRTLYKRVRVMRVMCRDPHFYPQTTRKHPQAT